MLNKVQLIGRLGADPTIRYMPSGDAIAELSVATERRWKDKQSGERKSESEWHRVTFFGPVAKVCGEYLKKGSQVYVEGRIKTDKYQKDGVDVYRTGIVGEQMNMLDGKQESTGQAAQPRQQVPAQQADEDYDEDLPF